MATVKLGQHGDALNDLDLARRLNAQIRAGQARLDFTGVNAVSAAFASALLDRLDLGRIGDDLGAETMADAVARVFAGGQAVDGFPEPAGDTVEPIVAADEP